jgi:glucose/arabinose dehydrogenase
MAGPVDRRTLAGLIALLSLAVGVLAVGPNESSARGGLKLKRVGGFEAPVYVDDAPGARGLLFVVEQPGAVRVVRKGKVLKRPFVNISDQVRYGGEQGLLSIAFDPDYERNRRFYLYYVNTAGNIRVDQMRRKKRTATRAEPRSRRKVIEIAHPQFENHNGGQLQFGQGESLFLATGDGGGAGDPNGNAQNRNSLLGKLLRIDPRKKGGYSTPSSNPFAGGDGQDEIYALGLRNPYRFSFDRKTGDLLIGDVGQDEWEEIDHTGFDAARGANFGWDLFEGNHVFDGDGTQPPGYKPPIHEYAQGASNCAVTGGYVVRDPGLPSLAGRYLYADFCVGDIRSLDPYASNPSATDASTGLAVNSPSSFGEGARGRIYVASLTGDVLRIAR